MTLAVDPESVRPYEAPISRLGWTRGQDCELLADSIGGEHVVRLEGDLKRACVASRIDLIVTRRLTSFDLTSMAVPYSVDFERITGVTAAVGGGPHSDLAASVTRRLAERLRVPGELATVHRNAGERREAEARLERLSTSFPDLDHRLVGAQSAEGLTATLSPTTLLVLGAAGGSWFQRQLLGPGHRLLVAAPCGAVVVRSAPRRVYHELEDARPRVLSPHLAVAEARRLLLHPTAPVADGGELVGILRRREADRAPAGAMVGDIMEPPVSVVTHEELSAVDDLAEFLDFGPIPVVDETGRIVGVTHPTVGPPKGRRTRR